MRASASPELKQATQQRMADLLDAVENDEALRDDCFNLALEAVGSCGDRVAKGLMDMEMQCLLRGAERAIDAGKYDADPQPLVNLLKGQKRFNIIADEVGDIVAGMHFADDIEAHTGALIKLKEPYALPIWVETMLYAQWSIVTDQHIAEIGKKLSNDGAMAEQKIANDQGWQTFLGA